MKPTIDTAKKKNKSILKQMTETWRFQFKKKEDVLTGFIEGTSLLQWIIDWTIASTKKNTEEIDRMHRNLLSPGSSFEKDEDIIVQQIAFYDKLKELENSPNFKQDETFNNRGVKDILDIPNLPDSIKDSFFDVIFKRADFNYLSDPRERSKMYETNRSHFLKMFEKVLSDVDWYKIEIEGRLKERGKWKKTVWEYNVDWHFTSLFDKFISYQESISGFKDIKLNFIYRLDDIVSQHPSIEATKFRDNIEEKFYKKTERESKNNNISGAKDFYEKSCLQWFIDKAKNSEEIEFFEVSTEADLDIILNKIDKAWDTATYEEMAKLLWVWAYPNQNIGNTINRFLDKYSKNISDFGCFEKIEKLYDKRIFSSPKFEESNVAHKYTKLLNAVHFYWMIEGRITDKDSSIDKIKPFLTDTKLIWKLLDTELLKTFETIRRGDEPTFTKLPGVKFTKTKLWDKKISIKNLQTVINYDITDTVSKNEFAYFMQQKPYKNTLEGYFTKLINFLHKTEKLEWDLLNKVKDCFIYGWYLRDELKDSELKKLINSVMTTNDITSINVNFSKLVNDKDFSKYTLLGILSNISDKLEPNTLWNYIAKLTNGINKEILLKEKDRDDNMWKKIKDNLDFLVELSFSLNRAVDEGKSIKDLFTKETLDIFNKESLKLNEVLWEYFSKVICNPKIEKDKWGKKYIWENSGGYEIIKLLLTFGARYHNNELLWGYYDKLVDAMIKNKLVIPTRKFVMEERWYRFHIVEDKETNKMLFTKTLWLFDRAWGNQDIVRRDLIADTIKWTNSAFLIEMVLENWDKIEQIFIDSHFDKNNQFTEDMENSYSSYLDDDLKALAERVMKFIYPDKNRREDWTKVANKIPEEQRLEMNKKMFALLKKLSSFAKQQKWTKGEDKLIKESILTNFSTAFVDRDIFQWSANLKDKTLIGNIDDVKDIFYDEITWDYKNTFSTYVYMAVNMISKDIDSYSMFTDKFLDDILSEDNKSIKGYDLVNEVLREWFPTHNEMLVNDEKKSEYLSFVRKLQLLNDSKKNSEDLETKALLEDIEKMNEDDKEQFQKDINKAIRELVYSKLFEELIKRKKSPFLKWILKETIAANPNMSSLKKLSLVKEYIALDPKDYRGLWETNLILKEPENK